MGTKPMVFFFDKVHVFLLFWVGILFLGFFLVPEQCFGRIYIDINKPSIPKFNIAIPEFKNLNENKESPELAQKLTEVISNDLYLSGYFNPMDKEAFLEEKDAPMTAEGIRFKDWSVVGAELLLKGGYNRVGSRVEVVVRLFDVFWGRQILGRRALGNLDQYRHLMHRLSNEIIRKLTGHDGISLTKLAFVSNTTGEKEVYVSDYDGYNVRQITSDKSIALLPSWSPDGKKLAYTSYKDGGPMLYLKDMASGLVKRISGRSGLNIGASWAPDGKKLALTLSRKGNSDIFTINLEGKILRHLVSHWALDVSPTFSPDGKRIAFASNRSGSPQIYTMDLTNGRQERLTFEGTYNTSPSWSSRNRIAFTSLEQGTFDLYTMGQEGGMVKKLTEGQGNNEAPWWSPDGRYIVFTSNREGRYHLYIMNANGQNQVRITSSKGDQTTPSWAP